jgi:hypothetical protein
MIFIQEITDEWQLLLNTTNKGIHKSQMYAVLAATAKSFELCVACCGFDNTYTKRRQAKLFKDICIAATNKPK